MLGALLFESPTTYSSSNNHNSGFLSLPNESLKSLTSMAEVPSFAHWLSNLDYEKVRETQLVYSPKILSDSYLRLRVAHILAENGLQNSPLSLQASFIGHLFSNIISLSRKLLDFGADAVPRVSLAMGIEQAIGFHHLNYPEKILEAAKGAHHTFVVTETADARNRSEEFEYVTCIHPRDAHAKKLMRSTMRGYLKQLNPNEMPMRSQRLQWVLENPKCICRVDINSVQKSVSNLVNWGAGAGFLKNSVSLNPRKFACGNEINFLSKISDIAIEEIFMMEGESPNLLPPVFDDISAGSLSYSYGLLLENVWYSYVINQTGRQRQNPLTAWIHAEDRIACLKSAIRLQSKGITVTGYGYGRINCKIPANSTSRKEFFIAAIEAGLYPQAGLMEGIPFTQKSEFWTDHQKNVILKWIGESELIVKLDEEFVNSVNSEF